MKSTVVLGCVSTLAGMLMSTSALAQAATAPAASADESTSSDIIVTARRKEESLQSTPVSITAFSQKALDQRSIRSPLELSKAVPGLQAVTTPGQSTNISFAIRGRGNNYGAAAGSVETYFADVPLSPPFQRPTLPPQFFDLQSFQVLKGPQGTLFGRSTTGGAVLIVPAAPVLGKTEGYARLQGGNYDNVQVEGAINVPLGEKAALRLAGFYWHRKGYNQTFGGAVDAFGKVLPSIDIDNQDVFEGRASLLLEPVDGLTNTTLFTYHADNNRGSMGTVVLRAGVFGGSTDPNAPVPLTQAGLPAVQPNRVDTDVDLAARGWSNTWAIINTTQLEVADNIKLKNILGYIHASDYTDGPLDSDGTRIAAIDLYQPRPQKNIQLTEELQLQGTVGKVDFIVGGLIDLTRNPHGKDMNLYVLSYPNSGNGFSQQFLDTNVNAKSVFASFTGHISDQLSVTGGIRYSHENVHQFRYDRVTAIPTYLANPALYNYAPPAGNGVTYFEDNQTFTGPSYNLGFDYKASSDSLIYGGYRHGWKRGGFNTSPPNPNVAQYGPEKDDDFYLGLKQNLAPLGLTGHFNIEAFYDIYHGAQNSYLTVKPGVGLAVVVDNAEKQTFYGLDMDFEIEATPWLELSGNYTFVDAKVNKWTDRSLISFLPAPADTSTDLSVNPVPYVSKHKLSLSARLHTDLGDGSEIALIPTMTYQSKFYDFATTMRVTNSASQLFLKGQQLNMASYGVGIIPAYTLADLRLEWNHVAGSRFDLAVTGTNLFNKHYFAGGNGSIYQFGFEQKVWAAPRMVTVEAKVRF